ncbi:putative O-glycosylation ligase, exosortase A system-associated [Methylomonas sp. SURF-1]|uniref:O-glycosylation ligase, exosortase A system-associated n=1 Tax=Methylomonas aurea TaxID=2952224 RepID=A0ABT1UEP1_9GAMM|nr:putative O-glycosylation ligase, exosortase A system-associated [Methylomonas sp. SURF-1]
MRDIVVLIFLTACIIAATKKPWWGVLSLAVFSYLNPHAYAWGFVRSLPAYYVLFLVLAVSTFATDDKQPIPKDWRIPVFISLWIYFIFTTALAPLQEIAWAKFIFICKIFAPFYFTWVLINTREKLYYLISTIGASIGIVAVKGGVFAIITAFGYRVYGPPNTQFEDNNLFAVAMLMAIPLLLVLEKELTKKWLKTGIMLTIPVIYAASLSSWSRGALLTMIALTFMLISDSKRKHLMIPVIIAGAFILIPAMPEEWFGRMHTLETYEEDLSAMSRIEAWVDGWNYALSHPFTGAGFDGWIHVTMRDWHSSYIEMLAEHGFIAFGLWISLLVGSVFSLTGLKRKAKRIDGMEWVIHYSSMVRASIICYMIGTAFLGLSYWDLIYHLIFISVLIKQFAAKEFSEREELRSEQFPSKAKPINVQAFKQK